MIYFLFSLYEPFINKMNVDKVVNAVVDFKEDDIVASFNDSVVLTRRL